MKPRIDSVRFGSIIVDGTRFEHDIVITLGGVQERKKRLSKQIYGTSHILSLAEIQKTLEDTWDSPTETLVVGTGYLNRVRLSSEAAEYLEHRRCQVKLCPTKEAARLWNELEGRVLGLFHITC
jgi:hypothetical protein